MQNLRPHPRYTSSESALEQDPWPICCVLEFRTHFNTPGPGVLTHAVYCADGMWTGASVVCL